MIFLALVLWAAPAAAERYGFAVCVRRTTPEAVLAEHPSGLNSQLLDYAACRELGSAESYCAFLPGGPRSSLPAPVVPQAGAYSYTTYSGEVRHKASLFEICESKGPAYALLAALVEGRQRSELVPIVKKMLMGEERIDPEGLALAYQEVFARGRLETAAVPEDVLRHGLLNHLLGPRACRTVASASVRRECLDKANAIRALKARDWRSCSPGDLLCRALVQGQGVCADLGKLLVESSCRRERRAQPPPPSGGRPAS